MNLLDWDQIPRVLLIGLYSGSTILIGYWLSWAAHRRHLEFLRSQIEYLENVLKEIRGRSDSSD